MSLIDLRARRELADAQYADAIAAWMAAGQQEPRPASEAKALDDAITEAEGEYAAMDTLRDRILEERIVFVAKHRKRLVADAQGDVERAQARCLKAIEELAQAREDLIGLRETTVWASLYPSETLATYAPSHILAGGRRRESERHGFQSAVVATAVFDLLRDDANVFTTISTREQAAAMQGTTTAALAGDEAMWSGSPEDDERRRRERERLIAAGGSTTVDALALLEAERHGLPPLGSE